MDATGGETQGGGRRIPVHPYLARQMSDFGFWQTLKVRTLGCARRSNLLPTYVSSSRKDLSKKDEHTRDTRFILVQATIVV